MKCMTSLLLEDIYSHRSAIGIFSQQYKHVTPFPSGFHSFLSLVYMRGEGEKESVCVSVWFRNVLSHFLAPS